MLRGIGTLYAQRPALADKYPGRAGGSDRVMPAAPCDWRQTAPSRQLVCRNDSSCACADDRFPSARTALRCQPERVLDSEGLHRNLASVGPAFIPKHTHL